MSVTGYGQPADGTAQAIYLRAVYATELSFVANSGAAFSVLTGIPIFRYLLLTGTGVDKMDAFQIRSAGITIDGVAVWNMRYGYYIQRGDLYGASSLTNTVSYCGAAIEAVSSYIAFPNNAWFMATSCLGYGIQCTGSYASLGKYYGAGIAQGASGLSPLMVREGSQVELWGGSDIYLNQANGIVFLAPGTLVHQGLVTIRNNGIRGIEMTGGFAWIEQTTFAGNAQGSVWAHDNAFVRAIGSTWDAFAAPISPPANTYGQNNNSFIYW